MLANPDWVADDVLIIKTNPYPASLNSIAFSLQHQKLQTNVPAINLPCTAPTSCVGGSGSGGDATWCFRSYALLPLSSAWPGAAGVVDLGLRIACPIRVGLAVIAPCLLCTAELGIDLAGILKKSRAILLYRLNSKYLDDLDMGGALMYVFLLGGLHLLVRRVATLLLIEGLLLNFTMILSGCTVESIERSDCRSISCIACLSCSHFASAG